MAITSSFSPNAGILTTFGDNLNNNITLSRNAAGQILVNGGAVAVKGGTPTVANTRRYRCSVRAVTTSSRSTRVTGPCQAPICSAAPATIR